MNEFLTPQQVADKTGLPLHDVVFLLETHVIPASVERGEWQIDPDALQNIITVAIAFLGKASKELTEN